MILRQLVRCQTSFTLLVTSWYLLAKYTLVDTKVLKWILKRKFNPFFFSVFFSDFQVLKWLVAQVRRLSGKNECYDVWITSDVRLESIISLSFKSFHCVLKVRLLKYWLTECQKIQFIVSILVNSPKTLTMSFADWKKKFFESIFL